MDGLSFDETTKHLKAVGYNIWFPASNPGLTNFSLGFGKSRRYHRSTMEPKCPSWKAVSWSTEDKQCLGSVPRVSIEHLDLDLAHLTLRAGGLFHQASQGCQEHNMPGRFPR